MSSKIISVIICVLMTTSIFGGFAQNVGVMNPSGYSIQESPSSEVSTPIPQNDGQPQYSGQPNPNSGGSGGPADSLWPMYHKNLNHNGQSSYDTKLYATGTPSPDIIVEKTANVTTAEAGDLIEYTIYYNNTATVTETPSGPQQLTFDDFT
jgi:uncharacterized repeat protein (TIGR01451 family)